MRTTESGTAVRPRDRSPPPVWMAGVPAGPRTGAGDVDHFDHMAGRRTREARWTRMPVFVTVNDHAAAQADRRNEKDGE